MLLRGKRLRLFGGSDLWTYSEPSEKGELKRVLIVATGALLSPLSYQQGESIPCVAHAVALESGGEEV